MKKKMRESQKQAPEMDPPESCLSQSFDGYYVMFANNELKMHTLHVLVLVHSSIRIILFF